MTKPTTFLTQNILNTITNVNERYAKMIKERDASWKAHLSSNEAAEDRRAEIEARNRAECQRAMMSVFGNNPVAKVLSTPAGGSY
jgi:hypothetical protein